MLEERKQIERHDRQTVRALADIGKEAISPLLRRGWGACPVEDGSYLAGEGTGVPAISFEAKFPFTNLIYRNGALDYLL